MNDGQDGISLPNASPTSEALLSPSSWLTSINFINHLVLFNNIMMTVVSEKGGGKTSFAKIVEKHLDRSIQCFSVRAEPMFSEKKLLELVNDTFHFSLAHGLDLSTLSRQINERQKHVLLVIDDAQNMDDHFVESLLEMIQSQKQSSYLHVLLIADYSILPLLNGLTKTTYKNRVHTIELGALTLPETSTYIKRCANLVKPIKNIDDKALMTEFYHQTEGALSQINAMFEKFFTQNKRKRNNVSTPKLMAAACFLLLFGGLAFYLQQSAFQSPFFRNTVKQPMIAVESNFIDSHRNGSHALTSSIPEITFSTHVDDVKESVIASVSWPMVRDIPKTTQLVTLIEKEKAQYEAADSSPLFLSSLSSIPSLASTKSSKKRAVKAQQGAKYTVQILASIKAADLKKVIKKNSFKDPVHIYKTVQNNVVWYVLTVGTFDQWYQAHDVIEQLPKNLIIHKPWIRPVTTLSSASEQA